MTASTTEQERADFLQMHADFERDFGPMPQDCKWSGRGFYQTSHHAWQAQEYANKFDGFKVAWQAARRAPAVPVPSRRPTLEEIEEAVGYHSSGWDCVDPSELIDAIMNIATAPKPPDDLKRGNPATKPDEGPSSCAHCGNPWGEAAPVQLPEPVAYLWQHCETGRTRVVMPDMVITADENWIVVGPLYLAAAPQPPEAAPVVLPEPVAKIEGGSLKWHIPDAGYSLPLRYLQGTQMLYTEQQVRQLLAEQARND